MHSAGRDSRRSLFELPLRAAARDQAGTKGSDGMALTIGQAARAAGVNVETIRFYERRGLIEQPPKPKGQTYREYPSETVSRIRSIRKARALGFSLREISDLLT